LRAPPGPSQGGGAEVWGFDQPFTQKVAGAKKESAAVYGDATHNYTRKHSRDCPLQLVYILGTGTGICLDLLLFLCTQSFLSFLPFFTHLYFT